MWIILLVIATIAFYFYKNNNKTVKCNIDSDGSCKMYNQRDIQSKCSSMCAEANPTYIFTGKHKQVENEHICECDYAEEKFTLDFTNVSENPDILPDIIPSDVKFSDRNYLEKTEEKRYRDLVFGAST